MLALTHIIDQLSACARPVRSSYFIPGLWFDPLQRAVGTAAVAIDPYSFYHDRLTAIRNSPAQPLIDGAPGGDWSANAIIYNLFPRVTTAFDHDADGTLQLGPNADGWRETGTLLKCIALLPYLRQMGFNTLHLLPITSVGQDGRKGDLGSPYAIRNPYQIDDNLAESALGLSADDLFAGFVEAAHHMGMRVVMEFVLRTSARDGDWITSHPEWFYWIRADVPDRAPGSADRNAYGTPIFEPWTLDTIKHKVYSGDFRDLPPPPDEYRRLFTLSPRAETIKRENGRYIGTLDDGTRVRIPGASTDWPPDDQQPPWGDVTYLRLFTHPDFNYIAYNTIRMYDERLTQPQYRNAPLWDALLGVIPHYQQQFGIDGVMIDMGHALPTPLKQQMVSTARAINPDFAFWDENFNISAASRVEGYNAVMGYWLFDVHNPGKVYDLLNAMARSPFPIRFFAAPENHNTPRAASRPGGLNYARYALTLCTSIPGMPFVLSGFELGETQPINTGLGFSAEQFAQYPAETLPLFSRYAFNWTRPDNLVNFIRERLTMRASHAAILNNDDPATFAIGGADNPSILVFTRHNNGNNVSVIANVDSENSHAGNALLPMRTHNGYAHIIARNGHNHGTGPLTERVVIPVDLSPGQALMLPDSAWNPQKRAP